MKPDIRDITTEELKECIAAAGYPGYRADQICRWLYSGRAAAFSCMSNLPSELREFLELKFSIFIPEIIKEMVSGDGTLKFLAVMKDGKAVETALIPDGDRLTLCVSTQAGCRYGCAFCASGRGGFERNLSVSEITGQFIAARQLALRRITNIVYMGVGEPLDNFENFIRSVNIFSDPEGFGLGRRKITVSTCGIVPKIRELTLLNTGIGLSVSLHSADDEKRSSLLPVNRKYPLGVLRASLEKFTKKSGYPVTLEYILISGFNMSEEDARKLQGFCSGFRSKLNLIPCNPVAGGGCETPGKKEIGQFTSTLERLGLFFTLRSPRGRDIEAACGQLRSTVLK